MAGTHTARGAPLGGIFGVLGAVVCLGLVAWMLGGPERFDTPEQTRPRPQGGVYRCAVTEPSTIQPLTQNGDVAERYVLRYTHDKLFDRDPVNGALRPAAAERVENGDAPGEYTFLLRQDLRFSDGAQLTAEDLEFLIRLAKHPRLEPKSGGARWLSRVDAEVVEGEVLALRVVLPNASRKTFEQFATAVPIIQAKGIQDLVERQSPGLSTDSDEFVDVVAALRDSGPGTGPFQIRDGQRIRDGSNALDLVPNPHSWHRRERPEHWNLAGIRLRYVNDPAAQLSAVIDQELDFLVPTDGTPESLQAQYPELAANYRVEKLRSAYTGCLFVGWNLRRTPLDRPEVRRLLGELFDREAVAEVAYQGTAKPAPGWYLDADSEGVSLTLAPERIEEIRKELIDLGVDPSEQKPLGVLTARESVQIQRAVDLAQAAFRRLGWELSPVSVDAAGLDQRIDDQDFDLFLQLNVQDVPRDPFDAFHSSSNRLGYASEEMDALLERMREPTDPETTRALDTRFEALLREDSPVTPLVHPSLNLLLHRRFQGTESGTMGLIPERWWVPLDARLPSER